MGNSTGSISGPSVSRDKKMHSKLVCVGCGCSDQWCSPVIASDVKCCCCEGSAKMDPTQLKEARDFCEARCGFKCGPVVGDAMNPLVDNNELIVVADKKLI
uniref:Uncharacterized protein n=1 Tax=Noctiluca scintillans TaxID=2966 RepID=A0A7S1AHN6_NOCSC|mmetsp:Transcript_46673/g.123864  ORF Transcript_46673/g.123864 Transcript_46673/m.123864 type:complete len:101 (+) Transcript_46673:69-371(+)